MRITVVGLASIFFMLLPASAGDNQRNAGEPASSWGELPANADCAQMKERVDAVRGVGQSPSGSSSIGNYNPNNSGITQWSIEARHQLAAGDAACAKGDRVAARERYQRAFDLLTASH